MMEHNKMTK